MDRPEARAREAVRGLGPRGRTRRIPSGVREREVACAQEARARGVSWSRMARAVGLSAVGVQRFAQARRTERRAALVPVRVPMPAAEALWAIMSFR